MTSRIGDHARLNFQQVEACSPPCRPLDYPAPHVNRGVRGNVQVIVNPATGQQRSLPGVIHRLASSNLGPPELAYYPVRQLEVAIYGSVWSCIILRPSATQSDARSEPILWKMTNDYVAIKMVEWKTVQRLRGRHIEDPIKEVAAMQLLGNGSKHVLGSIEVLQDDDYLYSVMRFCRGGDLFGVVVSYSERESVDGEEARMTEPMIRYWFRQILKVRRAVKHYFQPLCQSSFST
jgi:serine/threonine protein kinase